MLNRDFKEFIALLNANQVKYMVVGGYAVALHGYPRYTKDLDIWLEISPQNAEKVISALNQFGFASLGLREQDFLEKDQVIQLGNPPNRIDLQTSISGVNFKSCYKNRKILKVEGIEVNFIGINDLKKNKIASGRLQDLADLEKLK